MKFINIILLSLALSCNLSATTALIDLPAHVVTYMIAFLFDPAVNPKAIDPYRAGSFYYTTQNNQNDFFPLQDCTRLLQTNSALRAQILTAASHLILKLSGNQNPAAVAHAMQEHPYTDIIIHCNAEANAIIDHLQNSKTLSTVLPRVKKLVLSGIKVSNIMPILQAPTLHELSLHCVDDAILNDPSCIFPELRSISINKSAQRINLLARLAAHTRHPITVVLQEHHFNFVYNLLHAMVTQHPGNNLPQIQIMHNNKQEPLLLNNTTCNALCTHDALREYCAQYNKLEITGNALQQLPKKFFNNTTDISLSYYDTEVTDTTCSVLNTKNINFLDFYRTTLNLNTTVFPHCKSLSVSHSTIKSNGYNFLCCTPNITALAVYSTIFVQNSQNNPITTPALLPDCHTIEASLHVLEDHEALQKTIPNIMHIMIMNNSVSIEDIATLLNAYSNLTTIKTRHHTSKLINNFTHQLIQLCPNPSYRIARIQGGDGTPYTITVAASDEAIFCEKFPHLSYIVEPDNT